MEKLLQNLRRIQDDCLKQMEKDVNEKPPRNIGGAVIKGESLNEKAWETAKATIPKLKKMKWQKDKVQIVIEKKFFLHCLNILGEFYLFRLADNMGTIFFRPNNFYFESRPKSFPNWILWILYIILILSVLGAFKFTLFSSLLAIASLLAGIWLEKVKSKQTQKMQAWKNLFINKPQLLLQGCSSKKVKYEAYDSYQLLKEGFSRAFIKITLKNSLWLGRDMAIKEAYNKTEEKKGQLAWLWQCGQATVMPDKFSLNHDKWGNVLQIEIDTGGPNLLPVIETDEVFIFDLKYFHTMERYFIEDKINEMINKVEKTVTQEIKSGRYDLIFP